MRINKYADRFIGRFSVFLLRWFVSFVSLLIIVKKENKNDFKLVLVWVCVCVYMYILFPALVVQVGHLFWIITSVHIPNNMLCKGKSVSVFLMHKSSTAIELYHSVSLSAYRTEAKCKSIYSKPFRPGLPQGRWINAPLHLPIVYGKGLLSWNNNRMLGYIEFHEQNRLNSDEKSFRIFCFACGFNIVEVIAVQSNSFHFLEIRGIPFDHTNEWTLFMNDQWIENNAFV